MKKKSKKLDKNNKRQADNDVKEVLNLKSSALKQLHRLSTEFDYAENFNSNNLKSLYIGYGLMSSKELATQIKNSDLTYIERSVIYTLLKMRVKDQKDSLDSIKYFHDRVVGKVMQQIEHSGNADSPIHVKTDQQNLEEMLDGMSPEDLATFEKLLQTTLATGATISEQRKKDTDK